VHRCGLRFVWTRCLSERERGRDIGDVGAGQDVSEGLGRARKYAIFITCEHDLFTKVEKCAFSVDTTDFLGFIIGPDSL
jgi:hypothetical protein